MSARIHPRVLFKCESHAGVYGLAVLLRKHSHSYVAEENRQNVPFSKGCSRKGILG